MKVFINKHLRNSQIRKLWVDDAQVLIVLNYLIRQQSLSLTPPYFYFFLTRFFPSPSHNISLHPPTHSFSVSHYFYLCSSIKIPTHHHYLKCQTFNQNKMFTFYLSRRNEEPLYVINIIRWVSYIITTMIPRCLSFYTLK